MLILKKTQAELNEIKLDDNINYLSIDRCRLTHIPKNFFPKNLITLEIKSSRIEKFQEDDFVNLTKLETLNLWDNNIDEFVGINIPSTLTVLNLSYNRVVAFEIDTKNLESINLGYNQLKAIPTCLLNKPNIFRELGRNEFHEVRRARRMDVAVVNRNHRVPINNDVGQINRNVINVEGNGPAVAVVNRNVRNNIQNIVQANYKLNANVHNTTIQDSVRTSIQKLYNLQTPYNYAYLKEIEKYYSSKHSSISYKLKTIFTKKFHHIKILKTLNETNYSFSYDTEKHLTTTYANLFERLWSFTKNHKNKPDIMENFRIQLNEGEDWCHVGKISRIVNTLASFTDIIVFQEPIHIRLSNKIAQIKKRVQEEEKDEYKILTRCKNELLQFMKDEDLSMEEQLVWLEPFEEDLKHLRQQRAHIGEKDGTLYDIEQDDEEEEKYPEEVGEKDGTLYDMTEYDAPPEYELPPGYSPPKMGFTETGYNVIPSTPQLDSDDDSDDELPPGYDIEQLRRRRMQKSPKQNFNMINRNNAAFTNLAVNAFLLN